MQIRDKIITDLIAPAYYSDVDDTISARFKWRKIANFSEAMSMLLHVLNIILTFSAGYFSYQWLSYMGGCSGVISIALKIFSTYSMKESKERNCELNAILKKLNIDEMPDIAFDLKESDNAALSLIPPTIASQPLASQPLANQPLSNQIVEVPNTGISSPIEPDF